MVGKAECSKCGGRMEEGAVVDMGYGGAVQSMWVEGLSHEGGSPEGQTGIKRKIAITTQRCGNCGYIDSYAK